MFQWIVTFIKNLFLKTNTMAKARFIIQKSKIDKGKVWVKYKARNGETFLFGENQENADDIIDAIEHMKIDIQEALIIRKDLKKKKE